MDTHKNASLTPKVERRWRALVDGGLTKAAASSDVLW